MASIIDLSGTFETARTAECMGLLLNLHNYPDAAPGSMGAVLGLTNHWNASDYDDLHDHYHFGVAFDAKAQRACIAKTLDINQKGQHAWGRNSGLIGNSLAAMATPKHQPQQHQLDALALLNAEQCYAWGLNPRGTIQLPKMRAYDSHDPARARIVRVGGEITVNLIHDHAELAKFDGYYPNRWDIGIHINYIRTHAATLYDELKGGKRKPVLTSLLRR